MNRNKKRKIPIWVRKILYFEANLPLATFPLKRNEILEDKIRKLKAKMKELEIEAHLDILTAVQCRTRNCEMCNGIKEKWDKK